MLRNFSVRSRWKGLRCRRQYLLFRAVTAGGGKVTECERAPPYRPEAKSPVRYGRGIKSDTERPAVVGDTIAFPKRPCSAIGPLRQTGLAPCSPTPGFAATCDRLGKGSGSAAKTGRKSTAANETPQPIRNRIPETAGRKKGCPTHVRAASDSCGPAAANSPKLAVSGSDTSLHSIFRIRPR